MTSTHEKCIAVHILGRVQGVGYRRAAQDEARRCQLRGTVRNLPDLSVEVVIAGPQPAVDDYIDWLHKGPAHAEVTQTSLEPGNIDSLSDDFVILAN